MDIGETNMDEKRGAFFSDAHMYESQDPLHRDLAGKNSAGEKMIAKGIKEGERKFIMTLEEAQKIGNIDFLFFGGDMVTGYGERGLTGPTSLENVKKFKATLDNYFLGTPRQFMAGGHELGYVLPLSTDPEGGPTEKSIQIFEENFNQLYYTYSEGRYKFVVLSSDLEMMSGGTESMIKRQKLQREFYKDEITYTGPEQKVVLMIHDPNALAPMFNFLEPNLDKIEKTFSGHLHAQWATQLFPNLCTLASSQLLELPLKPLFDKYFPGKADEVWAYYSQYRNINKIWKSVKLVTIPAPGGIGGIGGGFLLADLKPEGIEVKKIKTPKE